MKIKGLFLLHAVFILCVECCCCCVSLAVLPCDWRCVWYRVSLYHVCRDGIYFVESLHPLWHPITAAIFRVTIKGTLYISHRTSWCYMCLMWVLGVQNYWFVCLLQNLIIMLFVHAHAQTTMTEFCIKFCSMITVIIL